MHFIFIFNNETHTHVHVQYDFYIIERTKMCSMQRFLITIALGEGGEVDCPSHRSQLSLPYYNTQIVPSPSSSSHWYRYESDFSSSSDYSVSVEPNACRSRTFQVTPFHCTATRWVRRFACIGDPPPPSG